METDVGPKLEMIGSPGAGKTTLCERLAGIPDGGKGRLLGLQKALWLSLTRRLGDAWWRRVVRLIPSSIGERNSPAIFMRTGDYSRAMATFCARNQALMRTVFAAQLPDAPDSKVCFWLLNMFAQYQFIDEKLEPGESLLLDEGFAQRAITLFAYGPSIDTELLERYANQIPLPEFLCVMTGRTEYHENRTMDRHSGPPERMRSLSLQARRTVYMQCDRIMDCIVPILERRGTAVIAVGSDSRPDDIAGRILMAMQDGCPVRNPGAGVVQ